MLRDKLIAFWLGSIYMDTYISICYDMYVMRYNHLLINNNWRINIYTQSPNPKYNDIRYTHKHRYACWTLVATLNTQCLLNVSWVSNVTPSIVLYCIVLRGPILRPMWPLAYRHSLSRRHKSTHILIAHRRNLISCAIDSMNCWRSCYMPPVSLIPAMFRSMVERFTI